MIRGFKLLRVEYIFVVIIPCLICIYLNRYNWVENVWILAGFAFYAMTGNTLNDAIDMKDPSEKDTLERTKGFHRKEILTLSIANFVIGTFCFLNVIIFKPILALYLAIIVGLVILYCFIKSVVILNHVLLGISHIFFPWFMVKINGGDTFLYFFPIMTLFEWMILACMAVVAFNGQLVHELIDGDSLAKLSPKKSQIIVWASAIVSLVIAIISLVLTWQLVFLPILIFPFGLMYVFRMPRADLLGRTSLKRTGIILGNFFLVFLLIFVVLFP